MKKLTITLLITTTQLCYANTWTVPDLAIGNNTLSQKIKHVNLQKGMDLYIVHRGHNGNEGYLLSTGILSPDEISSTTKKLKKVSIVFSVESASETDPYGKTLGNIIRIRGFSNADEAQNLANRLSSDGIYFSVRDTAQEGLPTTGPFIISLLRVDLNEYEGKIHSVLAKDTLQNAETVTSMVNRSKAKAGVNGGFFAFDNEVGDFGAPAGIYVKNSQLLREATNHRPVMILDNSDITTKIIFANSVESKVLLKIGNKKIQVDGLNRKPGLLLNCGGYRSKPTTEAVHDFVCSNDDEIIIYNKFYGKKTPSTTGTEITLSKNGDVINISQQPGVNIDMNNTYIQLTGRQFIPIKLGDKVYVESYIFVDGKAYKPNNNVSMISAGPTLISNGEFAINLRNTQGWNPYPDISNVKGGQDDDNIGNSANANNREGFYEGWVLRRHPRTAIGVTKDNVVYTVVVYGRTPKVTEGATITEMSQLMKALNVDNAMNLDGGGSSMMVVNGKPTGQSSDGNEREISDSVVFVSN